MLVSTSEVSEQGHWHGGLMKRDHEQEPFDECEARQRLGRASTMWLDHPGPWRLAIGTREMEPVQLAGGTNPRTLIESGSIEGEADLDAIRHAVFTIDAMGCIAD